MYFVLFSFFFFFYVFVIFFFFFQAEDGIRDRDVTGVQTCASDLPLPTLFYWPEAANLGDLMRLWVRTGV